MRITPFYILYPTHIIVGILLLSSFLFSCKKENTLKEVKAEDDIELLTTYLISKGFKANDIAFEKGRFILEKDIIIKREDVAARMKIESAFNGPQTEHWRHNYLVSGTYNSDIKIVLDLDVPLGWVLAIQNAVANWNNMNGTRIGMSFTANYSMSNTRILMGTYNGESWIARALLPTVDGKPGLTIEINHYYDTLENSEKEFAITHELGHIIGFRHTNQSNGIFIPGTAVSDPLSVMNATVLPWNGFTTGDIQATQILYPL